MLPALDAQVFVLVAPLQLPSDQTGGALHGNIVPARVKPVFEYALFVVPPAKLVFRSLRRRRTRGSVAFVTSARIYSCIQYVHNVYDNSSAGIVFHGVDYYCTYDVCLQLTSDMYSYMRV